MHDGEVAENGTSWLLTSFRDLQYFVSEKIVSERATVSVNWNWRSVQNARKMWCWRVKQYRMFRMAYPLHSIPLSRWNSTRNGKRPKERAIYLWILFKTNAHRGRILAVLLSGHTILVPRGLAPFAQHQELEIKACAYSYSQICQTWLWAYAEFDFWYWPKGAGPLGTYTTALVYDLRLWGTKYI